MTNKISKVAELVRVETAPAVKSTPLSFYSDSSDFDNLYLGLSNVDWDQVDPTGSLELNYQVECARQDEGCEAFAGFDVVYNAIVTRNLLNHPKLANIVPWLHADGGDEIDNAYQPAGFGDGFTLHVCAINVGAAVRYLRAMYDDGCCYADPSSVVRNITTASAAIRCGSITDDQLIACVMAVYRELSDLRIQDYVFSEDRDEESHLMSELDGNTSYYLYR